MMNHINSYFKDLYSEHPLLLFFFSQVEYTNQLLKICVDGNPDVEEITSLVDFGVNLDIADEVENFVFRCIHFSFS